MPIPSPLPNGNFRTPDMTALAVDLGGTNRSASLYVTWADYSNGDADVYLMYSRDAGGTWDGPTRVNNDTQGHGKDQFYPAVAVSAEGIISTGEGVMIQPPDYIRAIQPYVPGKPIEELERELGIQNSIKLASNENPLGPSPGALKAIDGSFSDLNRYPDGAGYYLKKALSETLSVHEDELILGNGSNELLDIAARTFMTAGDEAVMAAPSFVVYGMAVQSVGGVSVQVPLKDFRHDLVAMADAVTPKTKMVFIANPNNPTGRFNTADEFDLFMSGMTDDILVVVDEAYYEYVSSPDYADSMKHFSAGKNLLGSGWRSTTS